MNILEKIIHHKRLIIQESKELRSPKLLEKSLYFESQTVSMVEYLNKDDKVGIIAEIKRSSPSTGMFHEEIDVERLSIGYMQAGASALSILTDHEYFKGANEDLTMARKFNYCPILRKDFIVDEYQIVETKSIGADCVLLIAACLSAKECRSLASFAKSLGLEVLLEIHSREEAISHINQSIDLVGVNNRNLKTFTTDIEHSVKLAQYLPENMPWISESGIRNAGQINKLKQSGYNGFLIGGYFMQHTDPARACRELVNTCYKAEL